MSCKRTLTLHMFTIVFNGELVETLFARIVFDGDRSIAVVLYCRLVHISSRHLYFSCTDPETHTDQISLSGYQSGGGVSQSVSERAVAVDFGTGVICVCGIAV